MAKSPPNPITVLRGHTGVVTALHFTDEVDDGITENPSLISGSDCGEIFIWSLKTERTYHKFEGHNQKMILYLYYYKSVLLSQGRDGKIQGWKFADGKWNIKCTFESSLFGFCTSTLFPMESTTYLITPTKDQSSVTFYDYDTSTVLRCFEHKRLPDNAGTFMPEMCMCMKVFMKETKLYLIMGYDSGFLSLWDYESNKEKSRLKCHPEVILCLDYDSNHRHRGISGSIDENLEAWKIDENEQLVKVRRVSIMNPGINVVKIRGDGKVFITGGQDNAIRVFSWKTLRALAILVWHRKPIFSLTWSNELTSKYFASGSKDTNISVASIYCDVK